MMSYDEIAYPVVVDDEGGLLLLGGHGRRAAMSDSRQGKARGETYLRGGPAGVKGLAIIVTGVVVIAVVVGFLTAQNSVVRYGSWASAGLLVLGYVVYRRRKVARRPSIASTLSDLSE